MKIIEWNINHRLGYSRNNMPDWVKSVIQSKDADIIVLTETSFMVPNWYEQYIQMFDRRTYYVFCSNNPDTVANQVTIAIRKELFTVEYVKSFLSEDHTYPDHLEVRCIHKLTNQEITIIGMRIHSINISDFEKKEEFKKILQSVMSNENVILAGDFNNYRRGLINDVWCFEKVSQLADCYDYSMYTPRGGSINDDIDGDYSFPEDHFFTRGNAIKITNLNYDRSFVNNDSNVYKWGTNFQKWKGKVNDKNIYDKIPDPFPDHAILEADFTIT